MGLVDRIRGVLGAGPEPDPADGQRGLAADGRSLSLASAFNLREMGGYPTLLGTTQYGRLLRSGGTRSITGGDKRWLMERYHLTHVLDLRGESEMPQLTDVFARTPGVRWANISFYDHDLSDPALAPVENPDNYLVDGYMRMLSNAGSVRRIVGFLAEVPADECALFHCAAGMDRTGMCALLVLGNAGASRETIVADYCYSFASIAEVDALLANGTVPKQGQARIFGLIDRRDAVSQVYDAIVAQHGSVRSYLLACGIPEPTLDALNERLLG